LIRLSITVKQRRQVDYAFTASLTSKGQVTVPAPVRRLLGVRARDKVMFVVRDGVVSVFPATSVTARTAGLLASDHPMLSAQAEKAAAEEAMAEEADRNG
jgi:AbrB family looped-hinge helix DNA binding protein